MKKLVLILMASLLFGCIPNGSSIAVNFAKKSSTSSSTLASASISSVQVINNQLVINGNGFSDVTNVRVNGNSLNENFSIESKTATKIIANSIRAFSFDVSKVFSLILSDANASATFAIDFSLCNATLNGKGFNCAAPVADKDVLAYDAVSGTWKPRPASGLNYLGAFNASTNPATGPSTQPAGAYYIISAGGTIAATPFAVGDWLVSNGSSWQKIDNSTAVLSVFGRNGAIVSQEADYTLELLGDVNFPVAPVAGKVLKYNGTHWIADDDLSGGGAGSVSTTTIVDGAVTDAKITSLSTSKLIGTISSAQIADGSIVNADINAAAGIEYSKLNIANGEIPAAKISGLPVLATILAATITDNDTTHSPSGEAVYEALQLKLGTGGGTLSVGTINGVPTPIGPSDIVNKAYTDLRLLKAGDIMTGVLTLDNDLKVKGGANYVTIKGSGSTANYDLILPINDGNANQVLKTDGAGVLAWVDVNDATVQAFAKSVLPTCAAGEVLKSNGSTFSCVTDNAGAAAFSGTGDRAVITTAGGALGVSTTTSTEIGYVSGVTSSIQTQLNAKQAALGFTPINKAGDTISSGTFTFSGTSALRAADPVAATDVVNKQYLETFGQWTKSGSNIYRPSGNVGIGTSAPTDKLTIVSDDEAATISTVNTSSSVGRYPGFTATNYSGSAGGFPSYNVTNYRGSISSYSQLLSGDVIGVFNGQAASNTTGSLVNTAQVEFRASANHTTTSTSSDIHFWTTPQSGTIMGNRMTIKDSGNVGIGTTAPFSLLHISGAVSDTTQESPDYSKSILLTNTDTTHGNYGGLGFANSTGLINAGIIAKHTNATGTYNSGSPATNKDSELMFQTSDANSNGAISTKMTIKGNGNVGIGTISPQSKLDVNGSVRLGTDATACSGTNAGAMRFNTPNVEYCNGTAWNPFTASGAGTVSSTSIADGTIVDADINASAAIAQSKIANLTTDLAGKQGLDSTLTSLAAYNTNGILVQTGADTFIGRSIAGTANRLSVANGDGVAGNPTLNIPTALLPSPVAGDVGKFLKATAADTSVWTALGLSDVTTALGFTPINKVGDTLTTGTFTFSGAAVLRTLDPVAGTDVANKQYVDSYGQWIKNGSDISYSLGNVGIGTTVPLYPLQVTSPYVKTDTTERVVSKFLSNEAYASNPFGLGVNILGGATLASRSVNLQTSDHNLSNGGNLLLQANSGKVGIGTTTPARQLQLGNTTQTDSVMAIFAKDDSQKGLDLGTDATNRWLIYNEKSSIDRSLNFYEEHTGVGGTAGTRMIILPGGNVGIGTSTPSLYQHGGTVRVLELHNSGTAINSQSQFTVSTGSTIALSAIGGVTAALPNSTAINKGVGFAGFATGASSTVATPSSTYTIATRDTTDSNWQERVRVSENGNVGIGTIAPAAKLEVNGKIIQGPNSTWGEKTTIGIDGPLASVTAATVGSTDGNLHMEAKDGKQIYINHYSVGSGHTLINTGTSTGNVGIGTISPDQKLVVFNGTTTGKYTTGGWTHSSDVRLKHDISPIEDALNKILKISGVEYKFNGDKENKTQLGFIAQDVEPYFPEVVQTDNKGFKSMIYSNLIAPLVESVKALYNRIMGVEKHNQMQDRQIASLKVENKKLNEGNERLMRENEAIKSYLCSKDPKAPICKLSR